MFNLLKNAAKFAPEDSCITVALEDENYNMIKVKVTDNGPGIHPKEMNKLFQPYSKIDSVEALKLNPAGRGLGLYLCHRICQHLSGGISCSSVPNQFTTFTFTMTGIQCKSDDHEKSQESGKANSYISFDMMDNNTTDNLILVAEDYFLNRLALRNILNDLLDLQKDKLLFAGNGNQAYKLIQKNCVGQKNMFAVLFLDLDLPEQSGVDLILKVQQLYITRQINELPEIVLTCASPTEAII